MKRSAGEVEALLRELAGHGLGGLNPSEEQMRVLIAEDRDGPLQFLNLLAYHDEARYPAGHAMASHHSSGAAAYALYGAVALRHVTQRGGRLVAWNDALQGLIGGGPKWHHVAIMEYPNTEAFLDMIRDPDYRTALVHRDAGLAETVIIVTRPLLGAASK